MALWRGIAALVLIFAACGPQPQEPGDRAALMALLGRAQAAHVTTLDAYGANLAATADQVIPELPFANNRPEPWARTDIADFGVARDAQSTLVRENMPRGAAIDVAGRFAHAGVLLDIRSLAWDRVLLDLNGGRVPDAALAAFAAGWQYDEARGDLTATPGHIHSLRPRARGLMVDFGTAPPEAFLGLIAILGENGVREITVSAGR